MVSAPCRQRRSHITGNCLENTWSLFEDSLKPYDLAVAGGSKSRPTCGPMSCYVGSGSIPDRGLLEIRSLHGGIKFVPNTVLEAWKVSGEMFRQGLISDILAQ
jgi:hypothetical protein